MLSFDLSGGSFLEQKHFLAMGQQWLRLESAWRILSVTVIQKRKSPSKRCAKDNKGTYVIPYACCRFDDQWRNFDTDETVAAEVIGWRLVSERRRFRPLRKR